MLASLDGRMWRSASTVHFEHRVGSQIPRGYHVSWRRVRQGRCFQTPSDLVGAAREVRREDGETTNPSLARGFKVCSHPGVDRI